MATEPTYVMLGMVFLFFGIVSIALGGLTAYFGARKSRKVGIALFIIGLIAFVLPWLWQPVIDKGGVVDTLIYVIAVSLGGALSAGLFVLMIITSEPKPEIVIPEEPEPASEEKAEDADKKSKEDKKEPELKEDSDEEDVATSSDEDSKDEESELPGESELMRMKKAELQELCKERGIDFEEGDTKAELVKKLEEKEGE